MEYENTTSRRLIHKLSQSLNPCSNGIRKYKQGKLVYCYRSRLNPCSNGIRKYNIMISKNSNNSGLNPCSNGIRKYHDWVCSRLLVWRVLILVLMEYENTCRRNSRIHRISEVLILVLMEYENTVCKSIS